MRDPCPCCQNESGCLCIVTLTELDELKKALARLVRTMEVGGGYTREAEAQAREDLGEDIGEPWVSLAEARKLLGSTAELED